MTKPLIALACALALSAPLAAQGEPTAVPSPGEIVAAAPAGEWVRIAPDDLLVMTLAPDAKGRERKVVIQLMPAPFSQDWVGNIRKLARAKWYDGIAVVRVQDNYVVQWGDPNNDNPEATGPAKVLPDGLAVMGESDYSAAFKPGMFTHRYTNWGKREALVPRGPMMVVPASDTDSSSSFADAYVTNVGFASGFPVGISYARKEPVTDPLTDKGFDQPDTVWPVHCYGMVGVGRNLSPDTGTGAELYTVIGHAPRHLDRNIALVGRVVEGIEHLSSLPRGTGALGFYETAEERTPILSIRVASDLPAADAASSSEAVGQQAQPRFEYLSTEGPTFARYADARANRRDAFFITPAGGADICNIPVPVRRVK